MKGCYDFRQLMTSGGMRAEEHMLPDHLLTEDANGKTLVPVQTIAFEESGLIPILGPIDEQMQMRILMMLAYGEAHRMKLSFLINSPGGSVIDGMGMLDHIMQYPYEIRLYCCGIAASMAALIFACRPGYRYISKHGKVMIHEPLIGGSGISGSATTILKTAESIMETKAMTNGLLAEFTGKTVEEIDKATSYDHFFSAEEAIDFGLCDRIGTIFDTGREEQAV